jgi:hypothetical protein
MSAAHELPTHRHRHRHRRRRRCRSPSSVRTALVALCNTPIDQLLGLARLHVPTRDDAATVRNEHVGRAAGDPLDAPRGGHDADDHTEKH